MEEQDRNFLEARKKMKSQKKAFQEGMKGNKSLKLQQITLEKLRLEKKNKILNHSAEEQEEADYFETLKIQDLEFFIKKKNQMSEDERKKKRYDALSSQKN